MIAANPFNGVGIAGLGFNVAAADRRRSSSPTACRPAAEAEAITWAADQGARVINLSIGGVRDPTTASLDTFSPPERDAIAYAYSKGVVVVSAVGNGDDSPAKPWNFADWPSALPHVIGVGALREDGSVPAVLEPRPALRRHGRARRGRLLDDPAQPDRQRRSSAARRPYSDCGPADFVDAIGTSFSAPQVSAAAALLLGVDPTLRPDQVGWLLERSATDVTPATARSAGRPRLADGLGPAATCSRALETLRRRVGIPRADAYEPNDDAGAERAPVRPAARRSPRRSTTGTTRPTCTRSSSRRATILSARLDELAPGRAHAALGARDDARRRPARALSQRRAAHAAP